jgi:hypothetical protein
MNVREAQYAIEESLYRLSVVEDLLDHLRGREIPCPIGEGTVPKDHVAYVERYLEDEQRRLETKIRELEELHVVEQRAGTVIPLPGLRRPDS